MASYRPTFDGCWAKVQRAKEHRDAIHALTQEAFRERAQWPTLGVRYDIQTDEHVLYVATVPHDFSPILRQLSVLAGDAIFNFRCALDYLVHELALWHTGGVLKAPHKTQFPIIDDPDNWPDTCKRWLGEVHPDHQAVLEGLQTYHRPGQMHPFKMLRQLNDTDKHRLLNVVMIPSGGIASPTLPIGPLIFTMSAFQQMATPGPFDIRAAELGAEIARVTLPVRHVDVDMVGYVSPCVAFEGGYAVTESLDGIGRAVILTVAKFLPPTT